MRLRALDELYFGLRAWGARVGQWMKRAQADDHPRPFLEGNVALIRDLLGDAETGVRMVINIGPDALLAFLRSDTYRNAYDIAVIGGPARGPEQARLDVDALLGIDAANTYFGALALDGAGVRYYGAHCMVIGRAHVADDTPLFDRDSYDLLVPPLAGRSPARTQRIVRSLRGRWADDAVEMLIMKLLPRLPAQQHLITVGNVSRLVMSDQEFVEVHRHGSIRIAHLDEVRHAQEDAALEAWVYGKARQRQSPTLVELRWLGQRDAVSRALRGARVPQRLASRQGKGDPWSV